jgi:hypothetical protein
MITWDDVVAIGRELPETEESTSYGRPALKVRGRFVAALRTNPDAVVVRCDLEEKPFLLDAQSDILFTTPHYDGWGYMLVRLEATTEDLREFLLDSWLLAAPKTLAKRVAGIEPA